jgi:hypothetical protein
LILYLREKKNFTNVTPSLFVSKKKKKKTLNNHQTPPALVSKIIITFQQPSTMAPLPQILPKITPLAAFLDTAETLIAIEDEGNHQHTMGQVPDQRETNTHKVLSTTC